MALPVGGAPWAWCPANPTRAWWPKCGALPPACPTTDDSGWEQPETIQERLSIGFTFAWYRLAFTMPESVKGQDAAGNRVFFECNVDNYGEVYIDGAIDRNIGVITGNNSPKRVALTDSAVPGTQHVVAVLVGNAPLGDPVGAIFFRHATLAFEEAPR